MSLTEILLALCVAVLVTAGMGTWIRYLGEEREATVLAQEMQNFVQLLQRYAENSPGEGDYSTQEGLPEAMTAFIHHTGRHYGMAIRRAVFGGEDVGQALFLFLEERVMPKRLLSKLRTKLSSGQKTVFFIGQAKTVDGALCLVADQGKLTLQHFSLSKVHEGMVVVCLLLFKHDVGADFLYRVSVPGSEHLNQMQTHLDMANNDITTVGSLGLVAETELGECTEEEVGKMKIWQDGEVSRVMHCKKTGSQFYWAWLMDSLIGLQDLQILGQGAVVAKPECGTGEAQIFVAPVAFANDKVASSLTALQAYAEDLENAWRIHIRLQTPGSNDWVYPEASLAQAQVLTVCRAQ